MSEAPAETVTAHLVLQTPKATRVAVDLSVRTAPVQLIELLPLAQQLADGLTQVALQEVRPEGREISCRNGCAACCRHLVPLSAVEARHIGRVIEALPDDRQSTVRERFDEAHARLEEAGLLETLEHPEAWKRHEARTIGSAYSQLGIACPFLEDESCSIYSERPIACREHVVTSPPEWCNSGSTINAQAVAPPTSVWGALARFEPRTTNSEVIPLVPLIMAPTWVEAHPDETPPRPGPDLLRELVGRLGPYNPDATPAMGVASVVESPDGLIVE
jgi:Fe-S-cluster containining protein